MSKIIVVIAFLSLLGFALHDKLKAHDEHVNNGLKEGAISEIIKIEGGYNYIYETWENTKYKVYITDGFNSRKECWIAEEEYGKTLYLNEYLRLDTTRLVYEDTIYKPAITTKK